MPLAWGRPLIACAVQQIGNAGMRWNGHAESMTPGDSVSHDSGLVMERSLSLHLEVTLIKFLSIKIRCPIF